MSDIPAFPSHGSMGEVAHEGMTLRDYYMGQALAGLMANPEIMDKDRFSAVSEGIRGGATILRVAEVHVDAMMEARDE